MLETGTRWLTLGTLGAALMFTLSAGPAIPGIASPTGENGQNSAKAEVPVYSTSPPTSARVLATRTTSKWSASVDTSSRAAVNAAYLRNYASGLSVRTGWTGKRLPLHHRNQLARPRGAATLRALNFSRSLAGLAPVTFSSTLNARSQRTALIMSANHSLSHDPPRSWSCWNSSGADNAGVANLALTYPAVSSAGVVGQYLTDAGRQQPRGRAPAVVAQPVQHHDGFGLDQHRERHHGDRTHVQLTPQPGVGRMADRRLLPERPRARAAAGRCRPATGRSASATPRSASTATGACSRR